MSFPEVLGCLALASLDVDTLRNLLQMGRLDTPVITTLVVDDQTTI